MEKLKQSHHIIGPSVSPDRIVSIKWEIDNPSASGSTLCEARKVQKEVEYLTRSGYRVLCVDLFFC